MLKGEKDSKYFVTIFLKKAFLLCISSKRHESSKYDKFYQKEFRNTEKKHFTKYLRTE